MPWSIFSQGGGKGAAVTWAEDLLKEIGAPLSRGNIQLVYDWEVSEGGGGQYNPLNQGPDPKHPNWSGGSQYGGGAADYNSWQHGLKAAGDYLNMKNFKQIKSDLKANHPNQARSAIVSSPWASSHYGWGSGFSSQALPGYKNALKKGGKIQTTAASGMKCPSIWSILINPTIAGPEYAACQVANNVNSPIVKWAMNPVDTMQRAALMFIGLVLIFIGTTLLGIPLALGAIGIGSKTGRQIRSIQRSYDGLTATGGESGGNTRGPSPEVRAERDRRLALAERMANIGEKKAETARLKERRLQMGTRHKSGKREPNPEPRHS